MSLNFSVMIGLSFQAFHSKQYGTSISWFCHNFLFELRMITILMDSFFFWLAHFFVCDIAAPIHEAWRRKAFVKNSCRFNPLCFKILYYKRVFFVLFFTKITFLYFTWKSSHPNKRYIAKSHDASCSILNA